jgi:type II secretory pathway pseudopilin PulG
MPGHLERDAGATLVELIVAIAILSIAIVAIVGGLGTSVIVSDMHRKQATAGTAVRDFGEAVVASPYVESCGAAASYADAFAAPAGFTRSVTRVARWNATTKLFVADTATGCAADTGVQKVSLSVASTDGRATESLDVVIRKPCRVGEPLCS